ncbi:MAG: anthranilate synthase family protein [Bifidobacteriaceae bacterium]|jgi:phenazine biosynthesis protein phzE|nr:anthranilate synthase family protein [Bifidobacteriaceae bacterium]
MTLLDSIFADPTQDYAIIKRKDALGKDFLSVMVGDVQRFESISSLPLPGTPTSGSPHDAGALLILVPFAQIAERGFAAHDDGSPLVGMSVTESETHLDIDQALARFPRVLLNPFDVGFDLPDKQFALAVQSIIDTEIGGGQGSNFVAMRTLTLNYEPFSALVPLEAFRRLVALEAAAYWTFAVHFCGRWLVGASPEQHLVLRDGIASMTPISGTYRYGRAGPSIEGLDDFLSQSKEREELNMVVDEELKMMAGACTALTVKGPFMRWMNALAHSGYLIEGAFQGDPRTILSETMFAPTVTGSPLENAFRVIKRTESSGRGYYGGIAAIVRNQGRKGFEMDSSILIRTADISGGGLSRIGVGATIVRHSDPRQECAETEAKAETIAAAFGVKRSSETAMNEAAAGALREAAGATSEYWRGIGSAAVTVAGAPRALVIDLEDRFTLLIAEQLREIGLDPVIMSITDADADAVVGFDLIVLGPGPGDPNNGGDERITRLGWLVRYLLGGRRPFLAICLSHQVLCIELGLTIERLTEPNQGRQATVQVFDELRTVGLYNTYSVICDDESAAVLATDGVEVWRDGDTGNVHGIRGERFSTMQFHPESFITLQGPEILASEVSRLLEEQVAGY